MIFEIGDVLVTVIGEFRVISKCFNLGEHRPTSEISEVGPSFRGWLRRANRQKSLDYRVLVLVLHTTFKIAKMTNLVFRAWSCKHRL